MVSWFGVRIPPGAPVLTKLRGVPPESCSPKSAVFAKDLPKPRVSQSMYPRGIAIRRGIAGKRELGGFGRGEQEGFPRSGTQ